MARIRTIKPTFTQDEELSALDAETHLLAAGLLTYADDEGYFNANPKLVQSAIFPTRELKCQITDMMQSLESVGYIQRQKCSDGKLYGKVVKFKEHQRVSHPQPSTILPLWERSGKFPESSVNVPEEFRQELNGIEGNGIEGNGKGDASFAAGYVLDKLPWTGKEARWAYEDQIAKAAKVMGKPVEEIAELMVERWQQYDSGDYPFKAGISKFISTGLWMSPEKWNRSNAPSGKFEQATKGLSEYLS